MKLISIPAATLDPLNLYRTSVIWINKDKVDYLYEGPLDTIIQIGDTKIYADASIETILRLLND